MESQYITLGGQMGDPQSDKAVGLQLPEINKLLKKYCNKVYCKEIDEMGPAIFVDGDLWQWDFEGFQRLRLSKKHRYIEIHIGMPRARWEFVSQNEIKSYLISHLEEALRLMATRLKKEKYAVNETDLWTDFAKVKNDFLFN